MTYTVSSGTINPSTSYHTIGRMVAVPLVSRMMPVPKTFVDVGCYVIREVNCESFSLQCFDTVGWVTGGASGL